jgi:hypothetical protein
LSKCSSAFDLVAPDVPETTTGAPSDARGRLYDSTPHDVVATKPWPAVTVLLASLAARG